MTAESGAGVDAPEGWGTDDPPVDAGSPTSGSSILDPPGIVVSSWAVTPRDRGSDMSCRVSPGACSATALGEVLPAHTLLEPYECSWCTCFGRYLEKHNLF